MALVRKKDQGKEIVVSEPDTAGGGAVVDLMEALKATLAGKSKGRAATPGAPSAPRTRKEPARSCRSGAHHPHPARRPARTPKGRAAPPVSVASRARARRR